MDISKDTACEICSSADDADNMLLCDKCNRGYHLKCVVPAMPSIPEGEWFCQKCEAKRASSKGKGTVGIGQKSAAARALVTDSDTDADDFQAPASKPAAGRLTSRQGTLLSKPSLLPGLLQILLDHAESSALLSTDPSSTHAIC